MQMIGCSDPPAGSSWGGRVAFGCVFSILLRPLVAESLEDFFERDELRRGGKKFGFLQKCRAHFFFYLSSREFFFDQTLQNLNEGDLKKGRMKSADFFVSLHSHKHLPTSFRPIIASHFPETRIRTLPAELFPSQTEKFRLLTEKKQKQTKIRKTESFKGVCEMMCRPMTPPTLPRSLPPPGGAVSSSVTPPPPCHCT